MTINNYDLAMVIGDLVDGRFDHLTMLQLAYRLTADLPESKIKAELHQQICRKFIANNAALLDQSKKGE